MKDITLRQVIGINSCREALNVRPPQELKKIYFKEGWQNHSALVKLADLAKSKKLKPEVLSLKKMNKIGGNSHQGVCVLVSALPAFDIETLGKNALVLVLDRVQDPRNFGAIIRTAWLMDVNCIFSSIRHSAMLSPFVMKAASGGVEHVPIEWHNNLSGGLMTLLRENQFSVYALDTHSRHCVFEEEFKGRVAFLLGGESKGLKQSLKKNCDKILSIPQTEEAASYNVSVTAGIVLGEYCRQKRMV